MPSLTDELAMGLALEQARFALDLNEVPVGCVIVVDGQVAAAAYNRRETDADPTAHAEVLALRAAGRALGTWKLTEADVFVTAEPCPMCAGALVNARVRRVVYGCPDPKAGAVATLFRLCDDPRLNHRMQIVGGCRQDEAAALLSEFFRHLRSR